MAHFGFTFKLQQQDGRGEKKAQNDLKRHNEESNDSVEVTATLGGPKPHRALVSLFMLICPFIAKQIKSENLCSETYSQRLFRCKEMKHGMNICLSAPSERSFSSC